MKFHFKMVICVSIYSINGKFTAILHRTLAVASNSTARLWIKVFSCFSSKNKWSKLISTNRSNRKLSRHSLSKRAHITNRMNLKLSFFEFRSVQARLVLVK